MEDYKAEIKNIISKYYSAQATHTQVFYKSTWEILMMCRGVIPQDPITEHDIFEVMKDLGFQIEKTQNEVNEDILLWAIWNKETFRTPTVAPKKGNTIPASIFPLKGE